MYTCLSAQRCGGLHPPPPLAALCNGTSHDLPPSRRLQQLKCFPAPELSRHCAVECLPDTLAPTAGASASCGCPLPQVLAASCAAHSMPHPDRCAARVRLRPSGTREVHHAPVTAQRRHQCGTRAAATRQSTTAASARATMRPPYSSCMQAPAAAAAAARAAATAPCQPALRLQAAARGPTVVRRAARARA
jgi:hypothetical protein